MLIQVLRDPFPFLNTGTSFWKYSWLIMLQQRGISLVKWAVSALWAQSLKSVIVFSALTTARHHHHQHRYYQHHCSSHHQHHHYPYSSSTLHSIMPSISNFRLLFGDQEILMIDYCTIGQSVQMVKKRKENAFSRGLHSVGCSSFCSNSWKHNSNTSKGWWAFPGSHGRGQVWIHRNWSLLENRAQGLPPHCKPSV